MYQVIMYRINDKYLGGVQTLTVSEALAMQKSKGIKRQIRFVNNQNAHQYAIG